MDIALPLIGGLVLLVLGGELFVRGAVQIAERLGVSPLMIGLTLVGFGTSTPELVTSVQASLSGSPGVAVGNIVGSNIANILVILGISALIVPIAVGEGALRRDGVIGLAVACALAGVAVFGMLDRAVGSIFLIGLVAYIAYAWREEQRAGPHDHTAAFDKALAFEELHPPRPAAPAATGWQPWAISGGLALGGLVLVVLGGGFLVDAAVDLARGWGVSETVIGLTIVAVGTSLPELVTSVVAAIRRHSDVALGNVLGSNIYNVLGIGGATALIAPTAVPAEIVRFDIWIMIAASALVLALGRTGWRIGRREGGVLLACYGVYVWAIWP
jgi:cation:H+ antiporter